MSKRLRVTGGFLRTYDEDSSSGCSSSGPAGMRNYIPSPISPTQGADLSYGGGSKSPLNSTVGPRDKTPARYLPYTIRPLVLRAKRKLQSEPNMLVTSTARRIMTALDKSAAPVVDSVKVHYDPVVASRPVFTPMRRTTAGPPILKSPMVPAPASKVVYNPAMHIHIPKLVDFGVNTDVTMGTVATLDSLRNSISMDECNGSPFGLAKAHGRHADDIGGGKIKTFTSRLHAPPLHPRKMEAKPAVEPKIASKFKFSKAWSNDELNVKLSKRDFREAMAKGISDEAGALCTKCKNEAPKNMSPSKEKELAPTFGTSTPSFATTASIKSTSQSAQWECPTCLVRNNMSHSNCPCCGEKQPSSGTKVSAPTDERKSTAAPSVFPTTGIKSQSAPVKNWECPSCMVHNKPDAAECVCCMTKNPSGATSSGSAPAKNWECPSCMVHNKPDAVECVCCMTKNPSGATSSGSAPAAAAAKTDFKFGFTSSTSSAEATKTNTGFSFGTPVSKDSSVKSNFTFGVTPATASFTTSPSTSTMFDASASKNESASSSSSNSLFQFGVKPDSSSSTKPSASAATTLKFGDTNKLQSETKMTPEPSKLFQFGSAPSSFGVNASPSSSVTSTSAALAKAASPLKDPSAQSNLQSSNPFFLGSGASLSTSVTPKIGGDLWNCQGCPAKSLTADECGGCGTRKPTDKLGSQLQMSAAKRFQFQPFSGGRPETKTKDVVDTREEPELKHKMPSQVAPSSISFTYTPPAEPSLKLKAQESSVFGGSSSLSSAVAPPASVVSPKTGNFLEALKTGQQFSFQAPSPGASVIPSAPAGSSAAPPAQLPAPSGTSSSNGFSSSLVSSTTGPPSGLFQMGSSNVPTFGQQPSSQTASSTGTNISSSTSGFSTAGNNSLKPGMFSFGATPSAMSNGPASTPQSSIFGSPAPSPASSTPIFGAVQSSTQATAGGAANQSTGFQFNAPAPASANPVTPFNVGAPPSTFSFGTPQPGAFSFQAQPSPGGGAGAGGERKIRKAARRIRP